MSRVQLFLPSTGASPICRPLQRWRIHSNWLAAVGSARQWLSTVAESDASESSIVNLVDFSDQIDVELSVLFCLVGCSAEPPSVSYRVTANGVSRREEIDSA